MSQALSEAARILGERIRETRVTLALSQEEIALLASMNVSNFGKIERGLSNPTFHSLVRIAAVLGIDPAVLVTGLGADSLPAKPAAFTAAEFIKEREARGG